MTNKKLYKYIESQLTYPTAKTEHKRIWESISDDFSEKYLATYLLYLETFAKLREMAKKDITQMNAKDAYMHNNVMASLINQNTTACRLLCLTPSTCKTGGTKGGRKPKDEGLKSIFISND